MGPWEISAATASASLIDLKLIDGVGSDVKSLGQEEPARHLEEEIALRLYILVLSTSARAGPAARWTPQASPGRL